MGKNVLLSVIIPVFNEEKNIKPLYLRLIKNLTSIDKNFEIIFVNDGSTDSSEKILKKIKQKDQKVIVISHRVNFGKADALETGFHFSKGKVIITMDSDLQNDPNEIPRFVEKIIQGYDLVLGWRVKRNDSLSRIIASRIINFFIFFLFGVKFRDFYCGFKCYRRRVLKELNPYGDLYRFTPLLAYKKRFKFIELPIRHHHRKFGKTKYAGFKLFQRALLDLGIILFAIKYPGISPMMFNGLGIVLFLLGLMAVVIRYLFFGLISASFGVLFLNIGFIAKLVLEKQIVNKQRMKNYIIVK